MERLLAHPAAAPLVHADHAHRAALPLASRPSAATGTFYEEPAVGRVDSAPWTFELGGLPLTNDTPVDNYYAYTHCFTARNMSNIRDAVEQYFRDNPGVHAMPIREAVFARDRANLVLDPQAGDKSSPYFVAKIGDSVRMRQFTKEGLTEGIGAYNSVYIKTPVRMQAREVLEMETPTLLMFQEVFRKRG